jgi:hypothetical protein
MKRTKKLMAVAVIGFALGGCAVQKWNPPPGGTEAQWLRDRYDCNRDVHMLQRSAPNTLAGDIGHFGYEQMVWRECMEARGYTRGPK